MIKPLFSSTVVRTLYLLSLLSFASAACTNITNINTSYDSSSDFTNEFPVVLNTLICPSSNTTGCQFAGKLYNITIPRYLNISSSPSLNPDPSNPDNHPLFALTSTQEDEIFALVGTTWAIHQNEGGISFTSPDAGVLDTRFIPRDRIIDNRVPQGNGGPSNSQFQVKANSNSTLEFLPQMRRLKGILRGCDGDMTAFEDVGIRAVAAYENTVLNSAGTSEDNVTEVGGALSTVSGNLTASSGSGAGTGSGTGSNSSSNTTKKSGGLRVGNGTGSAGIAALVMSFMLAGMVALL